MENNAKSGCCCQSACGDNQPAKKERWITGYIKTNIGMVPKVSNSLSFSDKLGEVKVKIGIGRNKYVITPGLYAVGNPDERSPVFVSANYMLSFNVLRKELLGIDSWILVLDTRGINVWCAAGKGTFGTNEIVNRIKQTKLDQVVSHRTLILPQLGAPGIAAHEVKKISGFKVVFGPVRAKDIKKYLDSGLKATPLMRKVYFTLKDRLVLTPLEFIGTFRYLFILIGIFLIKNWILSGSASIDKVMLITLRELLPFFGAVFVGTVLVPLLLPWIPGKAFAWKGGLLGAVWAGLYFFLLQEITSPINIIGKLFIITSISSFLAMNFTGASTYTSLSGVIKEMQIAVPVQLSLGLLGIVLLIVDIVII